MTSEAHARHIDFEGCTNFRDLGGYRTTDGRTTRWRTLFRSGDPSLMTAADMDRARSLGISTVIDFRSGSAIGLLVSTLSQEASSYCPLAFEPEWVDQSLLASWPDGGLSYMRHPSARARLKAGLEALASESGLPAVFHCSAGKDRTGLFASVILGTLGIVETDIAADFALSARYYDREKSAAMVEAIIARASESEKAGLRERAARILAAQSGAPPAAEEMLDLLEGVRAEYGSMRSYALGIGVDEVTLASLEAALLEGDGVREPVSSRREGI